MMDSLEDAVMALVLREHRKEIDRDERNDGLRAIWQRPAAAGLTSAERTAIAERACERAMEIMDEIRFGQGGRWQ